jgi:hypothetical protein
MVNSHSLVSVPSSHTHSSAKSTSASCPGWWTLGTVTQATPPPSSRRSRATYLRTVDSPSSAPYSATSRSQTRRPVWRCFFGSASSAVTHARISGFQASSTGLGRSACLRWGGTALSNA